MSLSRISNTLVELAQTTSTFYDLRPMVKGRFIYLGEKKFYMKGVTYGTFRPDANGDLFPPSDTVSADFRQMAESGINSVRVYTVPPRWLLNLAHNAGLRVMVGLPWEQHLTFLEKRQQGKEIIRRVTTEIRSIAQHPAILCYAIGNEIPASIVRWYGKKKIEDFLKEMYLAVKAIDNLALVTYVNYPPTEYLQLSFLDFFCFNVYLESEDRLNAYLMRLHNLAHERPLVMAEIGLDSQRNGVDKQAEVLDWQIQNTLYSGAAGVFVFSWTDEWYRGGYEIEDWDFGLTTRERQPKQALERVAQAFDQELIQPDKEYPKITVAICTYNGASTLQECLEGVFALNYPDFEVVVVSDGSTDATEVIVQGFECKLIATSNQGLSSARNTAWQHATGEIVAYLDDDAYPDPDWLTHLAHTFMNTDFAAVGGPNIPPPDDKDIAVCVAQSPGGPNHVLISDQVAEHIPGCNMAIRRDVLEGVGGFDPTFRVAGDDVDMCWRIQEKAWEIGFHPAAMVWHHRRNKIRTYWRQQKGYGKAEALLEKKWPQKFNPLGHLDWGGKLYGSGLRHALLHPRWQVYHGVWGTGFFQSLYERTPGKWPSLPLMPEWYLLLAGLMGTGLLGFIWTPLKWVFLLFAIGLILTIFQATRNVFVHDTGFPAYIKKGKRLKLKCITLWLHLTQPLARLLGRLSWGLTFWRKRNKLSVAWPWVRKFEYWSEEWKSAEDWLSGLETYGMQQGAMVMRGTSPDRWDLEFREGASTSTRILMAIEEHGGGKQMLKFRVWPEYSHSQLILMLIFLGLGTWAILDDAWFAGLMLIFFSWILGNVFLRYNFPLLQHYFKQL